MSADYARFGVYQTELDFDLECRDCRDWRTGTLDVGHCRTLQDLISVADEHVRVVHQARTEETFHVADYRRHDGPRAQCDRCAVVGEVDR